MHFAYCLTQRAEQSILTQADDTTLNSDVYWDYEVCPSTSATAPACCPHLHVRFLIGASVVHKRFKKIGDPETKLLPFPAMEVKISKYALLNLNG